jgi:hypothetical protein
MAQLRRQFVFLRNPGKIKSRLRDIRASHCRRCRIFGAGVESIVAGEEANFVIQASATQLQPSVSQ